MCAEELGALLACIELPTGCTIGLGMGKPFGFGRFKTHVAMIDVMDIANVYESLPTPMFRQPSSEEIHSWIKRFADTLYTAYLSSQPGNKDGKHDLEKRNLNDLAFIRDLIRILAAPQPEAPVHYPRVSSEMPDPGPQIEWSKKHKETILPSPCSGRYLKMDE
jgi:hypothetical protein